MKFHDKLCDKIFDGFELKQEVKDKLNEISDAFIEFLEVPEDAIKDVVLTGSMMSYNYTQYSDIDLHLLVDFDKVHEDCPIVEGYLLSKKSEFNKNHDIFIYGIPVEVYAESIDNTNVHNGLYSLKQDKWIDKPKKIPPTDNDAAVALKYNEYKMAADLVDDSEVAADLIKKIKNMRKSGLEEVGEFSTENLTFKKLRDTGVIGKLMDIKKKGIDKQLSLESYQESLQDDVQEAISLIAEGMGHLAFDYNYDKFEKKFDKIREMKQPKAQLKRAKDLLLDIQGRLVDEEYDEYNEKVDAFIFKKNESDDKIKNESTIQKRYKMDINSVLDHLVGYEVDIDDYYLKGDTFTVVYSEDGETTDKVSITTKELEEELGVKDLVWKYDDNGTLDRIVFTRETIEEDVDTLCDKVDAVSNDITDMINSISQTSMAEKLNEEMSKFLKEDDYDYDDEDYEDYEEEEPQYIDEWQILYKDIEDDDEYFEEDEEGAYARFEEVDKDKVSQFIKKTYKIVDGEIEEDWVEVIYDNLDESLSNLNESFKRILK